MRAVVIAALLLLAACATEDRPGLTWDWNRAAAGAAYGAAVATPQRVQTTCTRLGASVVCN